jgi:lysophospholipase L1-like esterase
MAENLVMRRRWLGFVIAVVLGPVASGWGEEKFLLEDEETILFFGDSITQAGGYIDYFEAFLLTRFPDRSFRVINHGISSETISGTTEPDHDPPRPWAHQRFTRDVAAWEPDVVVACFGMNDGNYYPFEPVRFEKYQKGIRRLIERTRNEAMARLVLMTPPPFDPYQRGAGDPKAITYGYKFPAVDYDETLRRYSEWVVSLRESGQQVVDLHSAMNTHLRKRRETRVSFHLAEDAVHPNATGHWLMAQQLLLELNAPPRVADVAIDLEAREATMGAVSNLTFNDGALSFVWKSPVPMGMDPEWDAESIRMEGVTDRLNRYRLRVNGLPPGGYGLYEGEALIEKFESEPLRVGIDLLTLPKLKTNRAGLQVLALVKQRREIVYRGWRASIAGTDGSKAQSMESAAADQARVSAIDAEINTLRRPVDLHLRFVPNE